MINIPQNKTGFSARVRMWMSVVDVREATGGVAVQMTVALSHSGGTFVIASEPVELPPCDADLVYTIDERRFERRVRLVHGMTAAKRETAIVFLDDVAPF